MNPTQWEVLDSYAAGMVLGNSLITLAFSLIMTALVKATSCFKRFENIDTLGLCRFPSAPLFVFQFLLQGTALGAAELVLYPPSTETFVLGLVAMMICIAVPCWVLWEVSVGVPERAFFTRDSHTICRPWLRAFVGGGEWVGVSAAQRWPRRYASVLLPYRQRWACFAVVEMAASIAIAGIQATAPDTPTACGHQKLCSALVFLILLLAEVFTRPQCRPRDCYLLTCLLLVQTLAMAFFAAGYYLHDPDHATFDIAATLLMAAAGLIMVKVVLDLGSEVYVFATGRRLRLQKEVEGESVLRVDCPVGAVDTLSTPGTLAVEEMTLLDVDPGMPLATGASLYVPSLSSYPSYVLGGSTVGPRSVDGTVERTLSGGGSRLLPQGRGGLFLL